MISYYIHILNNNNNNNNNIYILSTYVYYFLCSLALSSQYKTIIIRA